MRNDPLEKPDSPIRLTGKRFDISRFPTLKSQPADKVFLVDDFVHCKRCGFGWIPIPGRRKQPELCESCRTRPALTIAYGQDRCVPHRGDFDEDDNPMKNGLLFMPGLRSCGHKDCVNGAHLSD